MVKESAIFRSQSKCFQDFAWNFSSYMVPKSLEHKNSQGMNLFFLSGSISRTNKKKYSLPVFSKVFCLYRTQRLNWNKLLIFSRKFRWAIFAKTKLILEKSKNLWFQSVFMKSTKCQPDNIVKFKDTIARNSLATTHSLCNKSRYSG